MDVLRGISIEQGPNNPSLIPASSIYDAVSSLLRHHYNIAIAPRTRLREQCGPDGRLSGERHNRSYEVTYDDEVIARYTPDGLVLIPTHTGMSAAIAQRYDDMLRPFCGQFYGWSAILLPGSDGQTQRAVLGRTPVTIRYDGSIDEQG